MQANYSNGTWGTVVSVTHENQTAIFPTGKTKLITKTWNVGAHTYTDPDDSRFSVTIDLGNRTAELTVPDVDPLWQQWVDEGLITQELLADVPRPQSEIDAELAAQFASAKQSKLAQLSAWWDSVVEAGVEVGGIRVPADKTSVATLRLDAATAMSNQAGSTLVYDADGLPHLLSNADFLTHAAAFQTAYESLLTTWNTKIAAIMAATTVEELNAISIG
jgi:hypothetical protein